MDDRIKVEGLGRLDGEYEIDAGAFTNRDLHTIKTISGVRAGELDEAWTHIDNDLMVAFTAIGLRKAGVTVDKDLIDALWDAPLGAITFIAADDEEADQLPFGTPAQQASRAAKRKREHARFWRVFEQRFGQAGELPESYWFAGLGHWCHLRPCDLNDLTPAQLSGCVDLIEQAGSGS